MTQWDEDFTKSIISRFKKGFPIFKSENTINTENNDREVVKSNINQLPEKTVATW